MTSKVIEAHKRSQKVTSLLKKSHLLRYIFCLKSNLIRIIYMNVKMQIFYTIKYNLNGHFFAMERFFTFFEPSNLITTMTYVLNDNFYTCF